ncbi:major facilitator superfamily domain-containing protein [Staphylotrichum tortipilum]|uniref:Major facilitator superfamily domain-containing protein n=1 Tax=Staphylotrichum tortipilum TaxID=2831512 RepID=A0AAN6RSN3_9PEZI|nr:major facilitator superfamily domain-containing protein [Staphylotrichum longicolle]
MSTTTTTIAASEEVTSPIAIPLATLPSTTSHRFRPAPSPSPSRSQPQASPPNPKTPLAKLLSASLSFLIAGLNDGALGALLPYLLRSYTITTALVTALYAANLAGWLVAALTATHLTQRAGLGGLLAAGAGLQALAHAVRCCWPGGPPWGVYVVSFWAVSLGQGWQDTGGNGFVAQLGVGEGAEGEDRKGKKGKGGGVAHRWLGFIHAMYMAGCLVAPFGAASIAAAGKVSRWWLFYTIPLGFGVVNLVFVLVAFRDSISLWGGKKGKQQPAGGEDTQEKRASGLIKAALSQRAVWLLGLFFFFYLGSVMTAGGWVVEYLVEVRNGDIAQMGYVPAGFSGGSLLGRILLPEPTHRFGEKRMVFLYCVLCVGLQLLFWLVPNIIAASVAISLFGFFSGPLFATAISVGAALFPADINATAISFVFVFSQIGGSLFPIVTGVLGAHVGVSVMQPILVGLLVATTISWLLVPQPKGKTK